MTDSALETKIREAFDSRHVPSPGLEDRVMAAMPWQARPERRPSAPRLAGALAAALAAAVIVVLVATTIATRLGTKVTPGGTGEASTYSLAAVTGDFVYVVQQGNGNVFLQSSDNGRSWVARLRFAGVYGGTEMLGDDGFVWSLDSASQSLTVYRTSDGGMTWTVMPRTTFPVADVFFLDSSLGWADSASPQSAADGHDLYATQDGGATWSRVGPLPPASSQAHAHGAGSQSVTFSRSSNGSLRGWYVGASQLFTTTDGGRSWHAVAFAAPAAVAGWKGIPQQPAFDDRGGVVVIRYQDPAGAADRVYLYASSDGGATWSDPRPAPAGFALGGEAISVSILDPQHVWLTGRYSAPGDGGQAAQSVARTSNGGVTWQVSENTPRIVQMTFLDPIRGYAVAVTGASNASGIFRTTDSGATWQHVTVPNFPAKS
jgi:photosystem II stability/assembly factor-like uncharacterized protein